jgi:hypothetical protein
MEERSQELVLGRSGGLALGLSGAEVVIEGFEVSPLRVGELTGPGSPQENVVHGVGVLWLWD